MRKFWPYVKSWWFRVFPKRNYFEEYLLDAENKALKEEQQRNRTKVTRR